MVEIYKRKTRGAFNTWRCRNKEKVPPPHIGGRKPLWIKEDVLEFIARKPWIKAQEPKPSGRKRKNPNDIDVRLS